MANTALRHGQPWFHGTNIKNVLAKLHAAIADHFLTLYDVDTSAKLGHHALSLDDGLMLSGSLTREISVTSKDTTEEDNDAMLMGQRRHEAAILVWLSYY